MGLITFDFETRSKADLKRVGAWKYSLDPSTIPLCLSWAVDDEEPNRWETADLKCPTTIYGAIAAKWVFEAHNSFFERAIWRNVMVARFHWPDIPDPLWRCSAALAGAHGLPRSLEAAGAAIDLTIQKNMDGHRLMLKMSKPRTPTKNNPARWHSDPEDFRKLYDYCDDDVRSERCLSDALAPLSPFEQHLWHLDQKINERGVRVDLPAVKKALEFAEKAKLDLNGEIGFLTRGSVQKTTQNARLLKWLRDQGVKTNSTDADTIVKILKHPKIPTFIKEVCQVRQLASKTSVAKYKKVLEAVCPDERLRDLLMMYGTITGRWAGKQVQPQNFPKNRFGPGLEEYFEFLKSARYAEFSAKYPQTLDVLSSTIRGIFIPSSGYRFYGGDFNAIELRVLMWHAGDEVTLEVLRQGGDLYVELARVIYDVLEVDTAQRDLGKAGILGCGFRMGAERFQSSCEERGMIIKSDLAQRVVTAYRDRYPRVVSLWDATELAAKDAISHPGQVKSVSKNSAITYQYGRGHDCLRCRLSSGRHITYWNPRIEPVMTPWGQLKPSITYMSVNSKTKRWERTSTHGGKLVENYVQGDARDILARAMVRSENAGYQVALTVHDELLTQGRIGDSHDDFTEIMNEAPSWTLKPIPLPLKVECWTGDRYLK